MIIHSENEIDASDLDKQLASYGDVDLLHVYWSVTNDDKSS